MNSKKPSASGHLQAVSALEFTYKASLERLSNKRAMESYNGNIVRISKTTYAYVANSFTFSLFLFSFCVCSNTGFNYISCLNFGHQDFLEFAVKDFNTLQCIHRKELKELER